MVVLLCFIFASVVLVVLLVVLKIFLSDTSIYCYSREEASSYECGFEQNSLSRVPVSIRFFTLTLVFLVFDLEIMLLMLTPQDVLLSCSTPLTISISVWLLLLLFFGLLFEWYDGSLDWVL